MRLTILQQKVVEISEVIMRMIGLDLVEKTTLMRDQIQRLGVCMADSLGSYLTSLPVSHHLSSSYYNIMT